MIPLKYDTNQGDLWLAALKLPLIRPFISESTIEKSSFVKISEQILNRDFGVPENNMQNRI